MKTELHIFTNCTASAPSIKTLMQTYLSFCDTFGKIENHVWCDPNPFKQKYKQYSENLKNYFTVSETDSLYDGYVRAIQSSTADYLFMLEHDWIFKKENICHTLDEIIIAMKEGKIYHLRFNKRKNVVKQWDKWLNQKCHIFCRPQFNRALLYCETPCISNNPHIIDRKKYLEFIKYMHASSGSHGIEEYLTRNTDLTGAIYGPLNHPATIIHLDGRK